MGSRIFTRAMEINDLGKVFLLGNKIYQPGTQGPLKWDEKNIADIISRDMGFSLVAARKKEITGFLIASKIDGEPPAVKIYWLAVMESLQNSGIEEMLLSALREKLLELNIGVMEMVIDENAEIMNILKKAGFAEKKRYLSMEAGISNYEKKL